MSSILPCTCFPRLSKPKPPPPSCSSLSCLLPLRPCGAKRLFRESGGTLVCMAYGLFYHVPLSGQTLCLFVSPNPPTRGVPQLQHPLHDASCVVSKGDCLVFPAGVKQHIYRPFAVLRLLVVAAWLRCNTEILPPYCSTDSACRSRLAASVSHYNITVY